MRHYLFVYGTLKKGFPNHDHYMRSARDLGKYQTIEKYPLVLCGPRYVEGELYEVDEECLNRIDALERVKDSDGYRRTVIRVSSSGRVNQDIREALAYFMLPEQITDRRSNDLKTYGPDQAKKYTPRK